MKNGRPCSTRVLRVCVYAENVRLRTPSLEKIKEIRVPTVRRLVATAVLVEQLTTEIENEPAAIVRTHVYTRRV